MTLELQCEQFPLTHDQCLQILSSVCRNVGVQEIGHVTLRCVSQQEIADMNMTYRKKSGPTNVLTFSYDDNEHDIALSMDVAKKEASDRGVALVDYVALLVTHACLHAIGMDHEISVEEELKTEELEKRILAETGFSAVTLFTL